MNIRLSSYADRTQGKVGFTIEQNGKILEEKIIKFKGNNIKENALHIIYLGLRACTSRVNHNDILVIEVQNRHLCEWLNGMVEYKGYDLWLDKVFTTLESLDCRYNFYFNNTPFVKKYMKDKGISKIEVSSIDDMMSDLE